MSEILDVMPKDWDKRPISLAYEIRDFLNSVKDEGTAIDTGTNGKTGDLWITVDGVEYFISIRHSNNQLAKDGVPEDDWPVTLPKRLLDGLKS